MKRIEGSAGVQLIECTHPAKNKWRIRWDVQAREDGSATYMEKEFRHQPTEDEIKLTIIGWLNARTDEAILAGFEWNGMKIWLSSENQFNYKAAYDLAVQTAGATLPVTFKFSAIRNQGASSLDHDEEQPEFSEAKFGTDDIPVYHTFETLEDLTDFYTKAMVHIQTSLADGWKKKDAFDIQHYRL